tara:strand:+ start:116 stop:439 length:324 start_codon:yes stop_codon:yes gene_type:complete
VFCVFSSSPLITYANDFINGTNAIKRRSYEEAATIFRAAAEKGDRHSQHCLGVMLYKGQGIKQDYNESFKWLDLAAKQGLSQAQFDLGILIYLKKGVRENYVDEYTQ